MDLDLTLLSGDDLGNENIAKLALFMGVQSKSLKLSTLELAGGERQPFSALGRACVIVSVQALLAAISRGSYPQGLGHFLPSEGSALFVYGFAGLPAEAELLKELTGCAVLSTKPAEKSGGFYQVQSDSRDICQQLSGFVVAIEPECKVATFVLGSARCGLRVLVTMGQEPFFLQLSCAGSQIFLAGTSEIPDIDGAVPREATLLSHFPSLVPLMMFLRRVFPERCWQNPQPAACFIVDDPLLRKEYGFLKYDVLVDLMDRCGFATSIAFIPWNCRRTDERVARLFLTHPKRLSLSVHGCDHSRAEFGATNEELLTFRARTALTRMELHECLSGVPFDKVMVFPQGTFSTAGLKALRSCGYLAAVNSTAYPVDACEGELTLRDLLDVAITRFSNFPLFVRRYPKNHAELALDLFLGKPALLVEHHGYFRGGYKALQEVVDRLSALDQRLEWSNLGTICSRACAKRTDRNGHIHVRFYTDRFVLANRSAEPLDLTLHRRNPPQETVKSVTVDGNPVDCAVKGDYLEIPLKLTGATLVEVIITRDYAAKARSSFKQGRLDRAKVYLRRHVSEFRDNYVHKSQFASKAAGILRRCIRR